MIPGFEEQTKPLTPEEDAMLPFLILGFKAHRGEANAIKTKDIIAGMRKVGAEKKIKYMDKFTGDRLRKMVNHIRRHGYIKELVSTSKGYWVETDMKIIAKCIGSIHARGKAILNVSAAMSKRWNARGAGQ